MAEQKRAAIYARELPLYPPGEKFLYSEEKWHNLDILLTTLKKDEITTIFVPFPETLGDSYAELLVNLSKVAQAGLYLHIAEPAPTIKRMENQDGA